MSKKNRANINISLELKSQLDAVRAAGQSYDGFIRELVKFYQERSKDYWNRRKEQRQSSKK